MTNTIAHQKHQRNLASLVQNWTEQPEFAKSWSLLQDKGFPSFSGCWGSGLAASIAAIDLYRASIDPGQPILVLCDTPQDADLLADEIQTFQPDSLPFDRFPMVEATNPELIVRDAAFGKRLRLVSRISENRIDPGHPCRMVACIGSVMQPVPSKDSLKKSTKTIKVGQEIEIEELSTWLSSNGMHQCTNVEAVGEFSKRGGIVDLFPPGNSWPVRIEFFDTEVESIREFDPATQRSQKQCSLVEIIAGAPKTVDTTNLLDLLPPNTIVIQVEPEEIDSEAKRRESTASEDFPVRSWDDLRKQFAGRPGATLQELNLDPSGTDFTFPIQPLDTFEGEVEQLRHHLDKIAEDFFVYMITPVEGELERLQEIMQSSKAVADGRFGLVVGDCKKGFRDHHNNVAVISCDEVFRRGELRRRRTKSVRGKAIDSFLELKDNDLVVHLAHGIGRFRGLVLLEKDGVEQEHLVVEFYGGTKIYVPATKMDLIQRYIGGSKKSPALAKIGGKSWLKVKDAAEDAIRDMAAEMLEVQAQRSLRPGIRFNPDTHWQMEFDQSFPYTETDDQLHAIDDIKNDMQSAQPMDRLLCGDVGFGKTEVAMRAAFKAVESGYQVALMVPTTVLAEQHYQTFRRRMASFPLDIAQLSKFCSRADQKETLKGLKTGKVDIVIGTHRLAGKEVKFFNLGLLIVDEEQKFGVDVKERLKALRSNVDVLTLSATPIPRTLHMSLVGVRNISNLETAPVDRIAVHTQLARFEPGLIRQAILRELGRNGQAFFVHNRISDIYILRDRLKAIVPEASFEVGHGQMDPEELESIMTRFVAGKFDVLIATTIVESGLDIPNANTMFVDEANRYGLSDLHQLRGRVGRYKNRAYCYLLIDPNTRLKATASKRLQAIQHFSDLGSGFSIAMRDLEIRGAGNLLGTEQSGHIAAIGYELYCQLLEKAVRRLKKEPQPISIDVDIQLPGRGFLPDDYVSDRRQKIDIYRRLARVEKYDDIAEMKKELVDRFGKIPPETEDLFKRIELKLDAAVWGINAINLNQKFIVFDFEDASRIEQLRSMKRKRLRTTDKNQAFWQLDKDYRWTDEKILMLAKKILRPEV